ncbi:hypothetical protein ATANTOWER_003997 [Ataeniobius toweri]|uniref:Uncharacterized protein n=1 Tax=Ataeniobius toweri TaxID=208326 RepID=A0ABU7AVV6_9TELE|nr:hypothetical protein [Ataeniobius toweri]
MLCNLDTDFDNEKVDFHNDGVPSPLPTPILYLPGLPDYGFYSAPSDQRGGPCSFADYGSLGPQAAQMLHSEHATSACNSPLQHLHSPDQFKNPGTNPSRPGGFPGANSPGPVADLYGPSNQDSAVGNYISAASPQPGSGFGPSITALFWTPTDILSSHTATVFIKVMFGSF